jgi:hypothetical protein
MSNDLQKVMVEYFKANRDFCDSRMEGNVHSMEELPSGVSSNMMASHGGENEGSDYWTVWEFSGGNEKVYIKFFGFYASHYGTDYLGFAVVRPFEKTVIDFAEIYRGYHQ